MTLALLAFAPPAKVELVVQPQNALASELNELFPDAVDVSIVLPTFNESRNIVAVIQGLDDVLGRLAGVSYEILVVDDDSPDRTWELAFNYASKHGLTHVRVMRRQGERGLASGVVRGWQAARGRILGVMDADQQHPPEVVGRLFAAIMNGATVAVGSRGVDGGGVSDWSLGRRLVSRSAQLAGLMIIPEVIGRVTDPMSGCFLLRRSALSGVSLNPKGYKILVEVLARANVPRITEVGYVFRERQLGSSKVSLRIYVEYLQQLLRLRFTLLAKPLFALCLVGSCGAVVDMVALYLLSDPATLHWGLTRSKVIGAELALISNFFMNDAWTFAAQVGLNRDRRAKFQRFLKFNALCGVGIALNIGILNLLFNRLAMNRYVANAIAIAIVTLWNYTLNLKLGWRTASVQFQTRSRLWKVT